ncbi:hypothetical protein ACWERA_38960, partial [Streptomyces mirabilis]
MSHTSRAVGCVVDGAPNNRLSTPDAVVIVVITVLALRGHEVSGQAPNRVVLNKETRKKWRHPVSTRR